MQWILHRLVPAMLSAFLLIMAGNGLAVRAEDSLPALPAPQPQFDVRPDYAGMAANFLAGIGKGSPKALEDHIDQRTADEIGRQVAAGDYKGASTTALRQLGEKLVGEIPVVGQMYALSQLGSQLGDWAIKHFGDDRYAMTYAHLSDIFGGDWPETRTEEAADLLSRGLNGPLRQFLEQNLGGQRSEAEWNRVLWDLMKGKHDFEILCDRFGLEGGDRTYENMQVAYARATEVALKTAQMLEEDRVAAEIVRLQKEAEAKAEAAKKAAEEAERKKREMEARRVALCAAWLGTGTTDLPFYTSPPEDDIVIELCGKAPPRPPAMSDATSSDDQATGSSADSPPEDDFSPDHDALAGIKWEIDAKPDGDRTLFTLKVTETYQSATFALHVSAEPIGEVESGGVIAGADRVDLMLGASHEFTVIATGDVEAVEITLWSMDARAASIRRPTLHLQDANADGAYVGACVSDGKTITVQFVIDGQDVRGWFRGDYDEYASYFDLNTHVAVSGATCDSERAAYDPKAERLTLDMPGLGDREFLESNDFHDAGDRITGFSFDIGLDGTLNGGVFAGSCRVGDPMGDVWEWSATK